MINRAVGILKREGINSLLKKGVSHMKWLSQDERKVWEHLYGKFDDTDYSKYDLPLPNETGFYFGEIVKWMQDISPREVLLAGDSREVARIISTMLNANVYSVGLGDTDRYWNFEATPLGIPNYDCIVSQAMLEHLINPYKHMCDLVSLLSPNGHLIVHTVSQGYPYHRYPIDALRFFPDWFEEVGKRLSLEVIHRRVKYNHIFYMYRRTNG